jgi:hypothetical protein
MTWSIVQTKDTCLACTFASAVVVDTFIFVFGGQRTDNEEVSDLVQIFDTVAKSWHVVTPSGKPL